LPETVEAVLETANAKRGHRRIVDSLVQTESRFVLENDVSLIPPLVGHLKENLFRMSGSDETGLIQVTVALREALHNAMEHGNLELDSELRERDEHAYQALAHERRRQKPYTDRRVHVTSRESASEATWIIRDEGRGFDPGKALDPAQPANVESRVGRGLLLMRTFMSEIRFNDRGNEVTLIRRVDEAT
jgi:anti-sigma regulatory factor (Ser/Thr protein kinase)